MRSWVTALIFAIALSCEAAPPAALPSDQQLADRLVKMAGEGARVRETDHFTIAYDTPYETLRPLIGRLEGTYDAIWRFCEGGGLKVAPPAERLRVILFNRREDYTRYRKSVGLSADWTAGNYSPVTNLAVFGNTRTRKEFTRIATRIKQLRDQMTQLRTTPTRSRSTRARQTLYQQLIALKSQRDTLVDRFNRFVIQHEAAHQMFFNVGVHVRGADNPIWLAEGLAGQFEVAQTDGLGRLRVVNHMRLADLREALQIGPGAKRISEKQYDDVFQTGRLLPLVDLVGEPQPFAGSNVNIAFRYAEAWGLVHYLCKHRREAFSTYLNLLAQRTPGRNRDRDGEIEDFESLFGPLDDNFQRGWVEAMLKLRYDRAAAGR